MKDPLGDFATRRHRNTEYKSRSEDYEDRRGDATGAAVGCPFDSIDAISFSNMMKRE
jgi:hypothetical protein